MSERSLTIKPLTAEAFAPYGQVITMANVQPMMINAGMTERYHDLAKVELAGAHARPLISLFRGQPYALPLTLRMVERHPLGSQAFFPLGPHPFLVIVAEDHHGTPGTPRAFLTGPGQGVNIAMNTWHGVLTPLEAVSDFLVVDRGGEGNNLEEFFFETLYVVTRQD
jgi:ureidoglycolate lyase